jgi:hypothetical protein
LLRLWRQHWHVEDQRHWVRDVAFDEEYPGVRAGAAPQVAPALCNAVIGLMRLLGCPNSADACRRFAAQPALALTVVGFPTQNA